MPSLSPGIAPKNANVVNIVQVLEPPGFSHFLVVACLSAFSSTYCVIIPLLICANKVKDSLLPSEHEEVRFLRKCGQNMNKKSKDTEISAKVVCWRIVSPCAGTVLPCFLCITSIGCNAFWKGVTKPNAYLFHFTWNTELHYTVPNCANQILFVPLEYESIATPSSLERHCQLAH